MERLYQQAENCGEALRQKDGELETLRVKISMLEANHQQLDGQMAVLRGNVTNNDANIVRIEEELKGTEDRSGGIIAQIEQTQQRISEIEEILSEKKQVLEVCI